MAVKIGATPEHSFEQPLGLLSDCHRRIELFLGVLTRIAEDARGGALTTRAAFRTDDCSPIFPGGCAQAHRR